MAYALHLQCSFRFRDKDDILVTKVVDAKVSRWGDLTINFDRGLVIEIFVNTTFEECRRFIYTD